MSELTFFWWCVVGLEILKERSDINFFSKSAEKYQNVRGGVARLTRCEILCFSWETLINETLSPKSPLWDVTGDSFCLRCALFLKRFYIITDPITRIRCVAVITAFVRTAQSTVLPGQTERRRLFLVLCSFKKRAIRHITWCRWF